MGNTQKTFIVFVPQQSSYVVEFLGKYSKVLNPGFNFLIPFLEKVAYQHSLKEQSFQISAQNAVTRDNVIINVDGVLYLKVQDPVKCSYGARDPLGYANILAQSTTRSEIGNLTLDQTFEERGQINQRILEQIQSAIEVWGVNCLRYEIKDIKISDSIKKVMNLEAESERKKRAEILISEGQKTSDINMAEADRRSKILRAQGKSQEILLKADAIVQRINQLNEAISNEQGQKAAQFNLAQQYIDTIKSMGGQDKNIVINYNISDPEEVVKKSLELLGKEETQNNKSN
ncbi:hypothetical protein ABPG72_004626 [Tetrahymena utriculariae]